MTGRSRRSRANAWSPSSFSGMLSAPRMCSSSYACRGNTSTSCPRRVVRSRWTSSRSTCLIIAVPLWRQMSKRDATSRSERQAARLLRWRARRRSPPAGPKLPVATSSSATPSITQSMGHLPDSHAAGVMPAAAVRSWGARSAPPRTPGRSGRPNLDRPPDRLRRLRHVHREHAVLEGRLDLVLIGAGRERHRAGEAAGPPLTAVVVLLLRLALLLAGAANREHPVLHVHLNVLLIEAGKIRAQHDLVLPVDHVHGR